MMCKLFGHKLRYYIGIVYNFRKEWYPKCSRKNCDYASTSVAYFEYPPYKLKDGFSLDKKDGGR